MLGFSVVSKYVRPTRFMVGRRPLGLLASSALVASGLVGAVVSAGPAAASVNPGSGCGTAALVAVNDSDKNLYRWTRSTPTSGSWSASSKVGAAWSGIRLTAMDEGSGDLFAVDTSGNMRRYWWSDSAYTGGTVIGTGWSSTTQLIPAGNGVLYAVRSDGSLYWYHWTDGAWDTLLDGTTKANGSKIGTGWDGFSVVFSGGAGILYGIRKSDGALVWYRNLSPGMGVASWQGPKVIGSGWGSMRTVVGFGRGAMQAVTASGALVSYTHTGYLTGAATWDNSGVGVQVGSGWSGWSRITGNPTACSPAAPGRSDNTTSPVYFVHGLGGNNSLNPTKGGWDCENYWGDARQRFKTLGWTGPIRTVGYYGADSNCEARAYTGGDLDTPIEDVGKALAWWVYRHNTLFGQSVDLIGHSLGGLVIRDAITGVENHRSGYPPMIYVEDAVTLGTPHQGTTLANLCPGVLVHQCVQIQPGSAFLASLGSNPQSQFGTDWTAIGAGDDDMVLPYQSTIGLGPEAAGRLAAGHVVLYYAGQFGQREIGIGQVHMRMLWAPNTNTYSVWHHDYHNEQLDPGTGDGLSGPITEFGVDGYDWPDFAPSPIDWAFQAAAHFSRW